jgi:CheY-like chemotaxis protein
MQALGTLTAGVAHNVNNMLAVILPTLDELESHVGTEGKALLHDASVAAQGAAEVVRQLMSFAGKRRQSHPTRVRVAEVVDSAVEICRRAITGPSIDLRLENDQERVRCDPGELRQVVVNLIANARDALQTSSSGPPLVQMRVRLATAAPIALAERDAGGQPQYVCLSVIDNGPGIDRETQRRIFDPFFTTKGPLGGTGLGLATAWSVVTANGGTIECESSPGAGACFRVYLPVAAETPAESSPTRPAQTTARSLCVLLVEDNEPVRRIVARILQRAGHTVIEATTAGEALQARSDAAIDAVLLDQSLPDGRGIRIVPELRQRHASVRILLFTGEDVADDDLRQVDGLISKPATGASLLRALAGDP